MVGSGGGIALEIFLEKDRRLAFMYRYCCLTTIAIKRGRALKLLEFLESILDIVDGSDLLDIHLYMLEKAIFVTSLCFLNQLFEL